MHQFGEYRDGRVLLDAKVPWAEGTRVKVTCLPVPEEAAASKEQVIVAGFGLAGRCIVEHLEHSGLAFSIIEVNPETVETQSRLGRWIVFGDVSKEEVLCQAGIENAGTLALTIPDEQAVLKATALARRLRPDIFIIARTNYTSSGLRAAQLGADVVVKAEQAVARQFYDHLCERLWRAAQSD